MGRGAAGGLLALILSGALAVRLWAFGGVSFGLGADDGRYAQVAQNLANGHAPAGEAEWFGGRVALLWPVAGAFRLAGAGDYSAVAWPLAGSLLAVLAAYLVGARIADRTVGLGAAAVMAAVPIEVLMATRLRPDALMPAFIGMAIWAALGADRGATEGRGRAILGWAALAGAFLLLACSTRESALVMAPIVALAGRRAGWSGGAAALAGGAVVAAGAAGALALAGGSPWLPFTGAAGATQTRNPLAAFDLSESYLGRLAAHAADPGHVGFLCLPLIAGALLAIAWRRQRAAILPLAWLGLGLLYLEVGTLANLDTPLRYLTLLSIPAALVVALAARDIPAASVAAAGLALVAAWLALAPLPAAERRPADVVLLNRVAAELRKLPPGPVLAEGYVWWAKLGAYSARERITLTKPPDPAFLAPAERRAARRLRPLPDPRAYAGGYVIVGPALRRAGWPLNWGRFRRAFWEEVPWHRLRPVRRVGTATIYHWPADDQPARRN